MGDGDETPRVRLGPQDEVGHRQVGNHLPVGNELVEPVQVGRAQVNKATDSERQEV